MKYLKLKMDFDGIVSRTVVVPADWSLAFLHGVIQAGLPCSVVRGSQNLRAWRPDPS